ncbi:MAG: GGDEF domain-containing protein [Pseudomonadota bacterium]
MLRTRAANLHHIQAGTKGERFCVLLLHLLNCRTSRRGVEIVMGLDSNGLGTTLSEMTIRDQLANQLWKGLFWLAMIGTPVSALRILAFGWRWIYAAHFALALLVLLVSLNRHRLHAKLKISLAIFIPFAIGLAALLTFGFYSSAVAWFAASCVTASMFLSRRLVLAVIGVEMSSILVAAAGFSHGFLVLPVNGSDFILNFYSWLPIFLGATIAVITLAFGIATYNESIRSLLLAIEVQRDEIARQRDLIQHQATHDELTGLPTLRLARDRLDMACSQARRDKNKAAVLFIDLDGFKAANDTFGHEAGDHVLKIVAQRLTASIRSTDTVARHGGDEFVVIMHGAVCIADTKRIANKLLRAIAEPIAYDQQIIKIGSSIGIAVFPDHAMTAEEMLKHADQAMYLVKKSGKNNYTVYSGDTPQPRDDA